MGGGAATSFASGSPYGVLGAGVGIESAGGGGGGGQPIPGGLRYGNPVRVGGGFQPQQRGVGVVGARGAAVGMGMMRPAGSGGGVGGAGGKVIPDVSTLGGEGGGRGERPQAKAPDSFSFVLDAMQDSIK